MYTGGVMWLRCDFPFSSTTIRLVFVLQFPLRCIRTNMKQKLLPLVYLFECKKTFKIVTAHLYSEVFYIRVYIERGSETVANKRWLKHTLMCSFCLLLVFCFSHERHLLYIQMKQCTKRDDMIWWWRWYLKQNLTKTQRKHRMYTVCSI